MDNTMLAKLNVHQEFVADRSALSEFVDHSEMVPNNACFGEGSDFPSRDWSCFLIRIGREYAMDS
jgi:hypothetical protein